MMKIKYTDSYMIYLKKKKPKSNFQITGNTKDRATKIIPEEYPQATMWDTLNDRWPGHFKKFILSPCGSPRKIGHNIITIVATFS